MDKNWTTWNTQAMQALDRGDIEQAERAFRQACPLRVVSALQGGNTYGTNSLAQCHQVCHCEEAAGRRGNLAVPDQITGKPSAKTQLPSRDCHGPFGASQ